ncbi:MAG: tRNA lysidine(34) synthetase TilS [Actinobacteria bacterium 13_2_20CM_2_72_6]|nr:MAG: tRNA lysidine(34) synthetase TilS [Actinobacteria bacterium 13_2_20CM_2_72_6]
MGPAPSVAAIRRAVRAVLPSGGLVLVACSGGADSLALAAAAAFVAPRTGVRAGLITVDHGLQAGSDDRAAQVAAWGAKLGLAPSRAVRVTVGRAGGPEAAARDARYAALADAAQEHGAAAVLLGHTREDQAETVLLALARGAGPRGIAGMPERRGIFRRPFLDVPRADTRAACAELGLTPWDDPHNADPSYARSRLRAALPVLVEALGADVVPNLARTARLVAADTAYLDELAAAVVPTGEPVCADLAALPAALRTRVLRAFALRLGAAPGALATAHIDALDALVVGWHGQGAVALPGGILVTRRAGRLTGPGTSAGTPAESHPPAG